MDNNLLSLIFFVLIFFFVACNPKNNSIIENKTHSAEGEISQPHILSGIANDMTFNSLSDLNTLKIPSKDSSNHTIIISQRDQINEKEKLYKKFVLENFSLKKSMNNYSLVEDLNKLNMNKALSEDEYVQLFTNSDNKTKNELLRRLTWEVFNPLKEYSTLQKVLEEYDKSDEHKSMLSYKKNLKSIYWNEIVVLHGLKGYQKTFKEMINGVEDTTSRKYDVSKIILFLSLEKDEQLIRDGCKYILERGHESDYYNTNDHLKLLRKLLENDYYYNFSIEYLTKILIRKNENLKKYNEHVAYLSYYLKDEIEEEDWMTLFETKGPLGFSAYERISENLTLSKEEFSYNEYGGSISINDMARYSEIEESLRDIIQIVRNNSLSARQKKYIKDDLLSKEINKIYGYIEPLIGTCFFYLYPEMNKAEFDQIFETHRKSENYLKLWKVLNFEEEDVLSKGIEFKLIEPTEMKGKIFEESYAFSAFPFDDHRFKSMMLNLGHSLNYDTDFGISPIPYDNLFINYLKPLKNQIQETKVLLFYNKMDNGYFYELNLVVGNKMYTCQSDSNGNLLANMRKLINTMLENQGHEKRLVSIVTEDTGTYDLYCVPDYLIKFYNHFELDLQVE